LFPVKVAQIHGVSLEFKSRGLHVTCASHLTHGLDGFDAATAEIFGHELISTPIIGKTSDKIDGFETY